MTPETMKRLAEPYFSVVHVNSWGNSLAAWWAHVYQESNALYQNQPKEAWMSTLTDSDPSNPFVIWGLFRR